MDVKEVRKRKQDLAAEINRLIEEFRDETESVVMDLNLERYDVEGQFGEIMTSKTVVNIDVFI